MEHPEAGLHLCHLLRLAHFYSVRLVLDAASKQLVQAARSLPASHCATAIAALQPLADSDAIGDALAACTAQLLRLMEPLDRIFEDHDLGATFEQLPLPAVLQVTQLKALHSSSQETGGAGGVPACPPACALLLIKL